MGGHYERSWRVPNADHLHGGHAGEVADWQGARRNVPVVSWTVKPASTSYEQSIKRHRVPLPETHGFVCVSTSSRLLTRQFFCF